MLIVLSKSNYIHPHIHAEKVESFHLIEGEMTVFLFNADGSLLQSIRMGDYRSDRVFYYRQTKPIYHTQIPTTAYAVFLEVTRGPFTSEGTTLAPWAPPEGPDGKLEAYIKGLLDRDRAQGA
jgi:glucose-6-phosphate isomerase